MRRFVKWLTIAIPVLFAVFVGGAYVLPSHVTVTRAIDIAAPPAKIFPYVNDLKAFSDWSPWRTYDPGAKITFGGPAQGVGQTMAWESEKPQVGKGTQTITASEADRRVETALDFGAMGKAKAAFDLAPQGDGTRVTWSLDNDLASPLERWVGLGFDSMIGPDYERGLKRLKALVETGAVPND